MTLETQHNAVKLACLFTQYLATAAEEVDRVEYHSESYGKTLRIDIFLKNVDAHKVSDLYMSIFDTYGDDEGFKDLYMTEGSAIFLRAGGTSYA